MWLKHLYQYFGSLDTARKSFLNEAADFNVCMWVSEHKKKRIKKMIALCIMAVILQSKCYQMSNQVPNLPVFIDVHLMNIKTVSWLSFFSRSVLLSLQHALYTRSAEQISRSDASGHLIKWAHFHQNIMEITPSYTKSWEMQLVWRSTT